MTPSTPPPTDVQVDEVGALQDIGLLLTRRVRKHSQTGLTMSQVSALSTLQRHGTLRIGELARKEQISKSSVTRLAANLETLGYVERKADPVDARSFTVGLTSHGHELLAAARRRANEYLAVQVGRLAEEDRLTILAALPSLQRLVGLS